MIDEKQIVPGDDADGIRNRCDGIQPAVWSGVDRRLPNPVCRRHWESYDSLRHHWKALHLSFGAADASADYCAQCKFNEKNLQLLHHGHFGILQLR